MDILGCELEFLNMSIFTDTVVRQHQEGVSYRELAKRFSIPLSKVFNIINEKERKERRARCPECGALLEKLPCPACQIKRRIRQTQAGGKEYYMPESSEKKNRLKKDRPADGGQDEKRPLCALELRPREYKRYLEVRRRRESAAPDELNG